MSVKPNFGGKNIPFVYKGDRLIYPNPAKNGLLLWYDFNGMRNSDTNKDVAKDLSGNGNDGQLQNFNYTAESGYNENKLLFDGADDYISTPKPSQPITGQFTWSAVITPYVDDKDMMLLSGSSTAHYIRIVKGVLAAAIPTADVPVVYFSPATKMIPNKTYLIHFMHDGDNVRIYANTEMVSEKQVGELPTESFLQRIGIYRTTDYRAFDGEIHSVKIYNRPLTPEEIQHNYQIEKERFGIE